MNKFLVLSFVVFFLGCADSVEVTPVVSGQADVTCADATGKEVPCK